MCLEAAPILRSVSLDTFCAHFQNYLQVWLTNESIHAYSVFDLPEVVFPPSSPHKSFVFVVVFFSNSTCLAMFVLVLKSKTFLSKRLVYHRCYKENKVTRQILYSKITMTCITIPYFTISQYCICTYTEVIALLLPCSTYTAALLEYLCGHSKVIVELLQSNRTTTSV